MKIRLFITTLSLSIFLVNEALAQDLTIDNPLDRFTRLIGGEWHLEGTYQVFEWGVGKKSVKSKSYFIINGEPTLVSEGSWFWHPGEKRIKGYFTAVQMPVELFDYTVSFEENVMKADLRSFTSSGKMSEYLETWEFVDDDHYTWTLYNQSPDGKKKVMGGNFERMNH